MVSCGTGRGTRARGAVSGLLASSPPSTAESKFLFPLGTSPAASEPPISDSA